MKQLLLSVNLINCFLFFSCDKNASEIHEEAFVVDAHNDVLLRSLTGRDILTDLPESHSDLPKFQRGGVDLQIFSIWVSPTEFKGKYFERANSMISQLEYLCSRAPNEWAIPYTYQDLIYNEQRSILSCMIGVEGGHSIENDLKKLDALYQRGMRYLGVTWNNDQPLPKISKASNWVRREDDQNQRTGWVMSYGWGPRFIFLGLPIKLNYAWQYNPITKAKSNRRYEVTIGIDL